MFFIEIICKTTQAISLQNKYLKSLFEKQDGKVAMMKDKQKKRLIIAKINQKFINIKHHKKAYLLV